MFPSYESRISSTHFSFLQVFFSFLISTYKVLARAWWNNQYLEQHRDALFPPARWSETGRRAGNRAPLTSGLWHCAYCELQATGHRSYTVRCNAVQRVIREDNGTLSAKCAWLSQIANYRQRRWAATGQAQCLHKHTHTHADLLCSWLCRHTEAPEPPPWQGRPIGAKAKEHWVPALGEHLWQPPTNANRFFFSFYTHDLYNSPNTDDSNQHKMPQCFPKCAGKAQGEENDGRVNTAVEPSWLFSPR